MDDYLIDRETLGRFVDELIKRKADASTDAAAANSAPDREALISQLDERIGLAVFGRFTPEQNTEFNQLLDQADTPADAYQDFFQKIGLDVENIISDTMKAFGAEYLGGQNA